MTLFATRYASLLHARQFAGCRLGLGLDVEFDRLPPSLTRNMNQDSAVRHMAIQEFTYGAASAVKELAIAFKPNLAFAEGEPNGDGVDAMRDALNQIRAENHNIPIVADGKRGDIGNSAKGYAKHLFGERSEQHFDADATTISPYMGYGDSMDAFIDKYRDRMNFILCRTSNKGADKLQNKRIEVTDYDEINELWNVTAGRFAEQHKTEIGWTNLWIAQYLYIAHCAVHQWNKYNNVGLVVDATAPDDLHKVCQIIAGSSVQLLIPWSKTRGGQLGVILQILKKENCLGQSVIFISQEALYPETGTDGEDWKQKIEARFRACHEEAFNILRY